MTHPTGSPDDLFLGARIAEMRRARGWSLRELRTRTGITISYLNSLEHGTRSNPSLAVVRTLAVAFEVDLVDLIGGGR